MYRHSDPTTSRDAAAGADNSAKAMREVIAQAVMRWPGRTSRELASLMGVEYAVVHKRMKELETEQRIRRGGDAKQRRCSIGGRRCETWYPRIKEGLFA